ncbi:FYN-binding protein-like, partial [Scleropages formosus]
DNKADVKAIMARFNAGGNSMEGPPAGRSTVHSTLSTGLPGQARKTALESSLSGGTTAPKPNFLKGTVSTQSAPETPEFPRPKVQIGKFAGGLEAGKTGAMPETAKPTFPKTQPFKPKPMEPSTDTEPKTPPPKPPSQKPLLSATLSDPKPISPKPPPAQVKPSWVKDSSKVEDSGSSSSNSPAPPSKLALAPKPKSTLTAMRSQADEPSAGETGPKSFTGSSAKSSAFRAAQNAFNKENTEDTSHDRPKPLGSHDTSGPKTPIAKKPSLIKKPVTLASQKENKDPFAPKKNPLPNILVLGSPPVKPNRPPKVNLEKFKTAAEQSNSEGPGGLKKADRPPPPTFHPSNNAAPPIPSQLVAPSLPPRPTGGIIQPDPDENYDDVGVMNNPPPLPAGGHPSQKQKDSGSDEEMYEDLDDRWSSTDAKEQEKKEKGDKRKQEQEKKEQKDKDRKEQEIRKKFKITGPIQVIHKVKARVDCRGSKMDLTVKQGEPIEIIRIMDNPEGRWLGRTRDGSYGYVKTDTVDIDFDTLKRKSGTLTNQANFEPEVYDDVAPLEDSGSGVRGPGVVLPPPPDEDGDIYDELDDSDLNVRVPPPPQFTPDINADNHTATNDEDVYDDVDSQPSYPSSNALSSLPMTLKGKLDEKDPKKQKKFEKEEKEFRKKFKFDGEIQVLYQVKVLPSLSIKKWVGKDLPLRPGETLDVIVKPVDNKLVCRNEEGKCEFLLLFRQWAGSRMEWNVDLLPEWDTNVSPREHLGFQWTLHG